MKRNADSDDSYGFIDALDVAAGAEILVRGNTVGETNALMAQEPLDGESLPVIERFASLDALIDAGWRVD